MPKTEFGNSLRDCEKKIKKPSKKSFGEDVSLIMRSMGIKSCKSGSSSACITAQAGWGATSGKACIGAEYAQGCEQIMANFNKTRIVKQALTCAINNRMQEATTLVNQVNNVDISAKGAECCTCGMFCQSLNSDGTTSSYKCTSIGAINQSNAADIKTVSHFSSDEASDIRNTILTAVKDDITLAADNKKEGLGMDSGQKVITGNEIETITETTDMSVSENIQKTLNQLSQKNVAVYNLDGMKSSGPCIESVNQSNVIKLVVDTIMTQTLTSIKKNVDSSTFEKILDVVATKDITGLDIGKDPPMGGLGSMMTVIGLAIIGGGIYIMIKGLGVPGSTFEDSMKGATGGDPKAMIIGASFISTLVFLFFLWLYLSIIAFWKSLKSGFGLF